MGGPLSLRLSVGFSTGHSAPKPAESVYQIGAISGAGVPVLSASQPVASRAGAMRPGALGVVRVQLRLCIPLAGEPVPGLGARVPLVGPLQHGLNPGFGPDHLGLAEHRVRVAFAPVQARLLMVGFSFAMVRLAVATVSITIPGVCLAVAVVGGGVEDTVAPPSLGGDVARLGGEVACGGRAVPTLRGLISLSADVVPEPLCLVADGSGGVAVAVGVRRVESGLAFIGQPVAFIGQPVAFNGDLVAPLGDAVTLVGGLASFGGPPVGIIGAAALTFALRHHPPCTFG